MMKCGDDADCHGDQKCCSNGCGRECSSPLRQGKYQNTQYHCYCCKFFILVNEKRTLLASNGNICWLTNGVALLQYKMYSLKKPAKNEIPCYGSCIKNQITDSHIQGARGSKIRPRHSVRIHVLCLHNSKKLPKPS